MEGKRERERGDIMSPKLLRGNTKTHPGGEDRSEDLKQSAVQ